jgi:hypothetical protein
MDTSAGRLVSLAKFGDEVSARIAAALLESAGIATRLHGESLGPYRMTIGEWAVTEILVAETDAEDAIEVLTASEIEFALSPEVRGGAVADRNNLPMRLVAGITLAIVVTAVIRSLMRVF